MRKCFYLILFLCHAYHNVAIAQELVMGGLQGDKPLLLTPSLAENRSIQGKSVFDVEYFGFSETERSFRFAPKLKEGWNWLAIFNAQVKGKPVNTFFYDSWVATDQPKTESNGRRRNFDEDITAKINSNAYHMAFQRRLNVENEIFMLIISPKKQKVVLEFDENTIGVSRRFEYEMEEMEAKFVHIIVPPKEYTVVMWKPENTLRETKDFSKGWKFHKGDLPKASEHSYNDVAWSKVDLPHTWNANELYDYRNYRDTIDVTTMIYRGVGWYRKSFSVDKSWQNKHVKVDFLAANQVAEVWLNGKYLGKHIGGYTGFHFGHNFGPNLYFDKPNVIAVKVDNSWNYDIPPHTADYNMLGGIYREVTLTATDHVFIKRALVTTPSVTAMDATVNTKVAIRNMSDNLRELTVVTNIISPYNEIIASNRQDISLEANAYPTLDLNFEIKQPLLWTPDYPHMYQVAVALYEKSTWQKNNKAIDQQFYPLGFRTLSFDASKGFSINGIPTKLKGVNVHQDFMHKGWAVDSAQKRSDFIHIKNMGANFVRMSHYPHHPYVMHLCDSLGLMVWSEIPVVNTIGREKFVENAVNMMEELILRDFNHPSIIMWGVGNEYYRNFFTKEDADFALKVTNEVAKKAKELDTFRPTVQAQNDLIDDRILPLTDIQGRNRYFGWYEKTYEDFKHEMLDEHEKYPDWKILVSEYGAEGKYGYHVNNPSLFDHSETYQINFHKAYWETIRDHDFILGSTIWNMFDFASFAKVGSIPHVNQKGMMTYDRKPKSIYYYYQSEWSSEPMVYINSHTWTHRYGFEGKKVDVFSNCDEVTLYLNGKSLGKRMKTEGFSWNIDFSIGFHQLKAVGVKEGITVQNAMQVYYQHDEPILDVKRVKPTGDG